MALSTEYKGKYGKGGRSDSEASLAALVTAGTPQLSVRHLLGGAMRLPASFSLEQYVQSVFDQGQTSSCVGWALAQAIFLRCLVMGVRIAFPSPECIYVVARAMERQLQNLTPAQAPLADEGSEPALAWLGLAQWGAASSDAWPFDAATINNEPDLELLEIASAFKVTGYYKLSSTGAQRSIDVQQAISSGYPVSIGVDVDQAFESYNGGKTNGVPNYVTQPDKKALLGGHELHLVGFQNFPNGKTLYRGVNQWTTGWGDSGLFWADDPWIQDSDAEATVVTVGPTGHEGGMNRKVAA
jgi:hypothetical protein